MAQGNGETGLLTRFVPERLKHSALYRWWLRFTRVLQFLSAAISLGIFSSRVYKVFRLYNSFRSARAIDNSLGAVEGILAAAVVYTIASTIMTFVLRGGGPKWLRWIWVLLDLLFVGAFIAVSVLTRPNGGPAGPSQCYNNRSEKVSGSGDNANRDDDSCNLPWGTFILAIISAVLHAITAAFHEVRDRYREKHMLHNKDRYNSEHGATDHRTRQSGNGYSHA